MNDGEQTRDLNGRREELKRSADDAASSQHRRGKLSARERVAGLLDPGTFVELDPFVEHRASAFGMDSRKGIGDGVITCHGKVDCRTVFVYAQDFSFMGGSVGEMHAKKICHLLDLAIESGAPVLGFHDSGGARIQEGVASLAGYGEIFRRIVSASGIIPMMAVIAGPTAGGASFSPALMDFIIMIRGLSTSFVMGPRVVKQETGEDVDEQRLGGADVHGAVSGVASITIENEKECFSTIRRLLSYLPQNNREKPRRAEPLEPEATINGDSIPKDPQSKYDIHDLIGKIVDRDSFFEIQPNFSRNAVVGFARLAGLVVGLVASQPSVLGGYMTIDSSDKIARFVRFCDCFNMPVITLQDVPGFKPGVEQEHGGVIRHGAKVIYAYAESTIPKVTVILRRSFAGAYISLGSKHLGVDFVYALPQAEIAVLGAEAAVEILYNREIAENPGKRDELIARYASEFANPYQAAKLGYIDDIITTKEIRPRIIAALELLDKKRERFELKKRHGNMPV